MQKGARGKGPPENPPTDFRQGSDHSTWGKESIYPHRSGPLLEKGLDRPENRYGRYGFASFPSISISTVGVDGARDSL